MRAIRFEKSGSLSELHLQELTKPTVKTDEVLVEIYAAAINPSDVKNVLGAMHHTTLPRTPGRDFAGVIVEGGTNLIGTEIWGSGGDLGFTRDGSHAEYMILPVDAVQPKPSHLSMLESAAVGTSYITAWMGLMDAAQLMPGETVLVIGATGAVGSAAIQIAKWKGAVVLGTIRNESDRESVEKLGCDTPEGSGCCHRVINLKQDDLKALVLEATNGKGINVVYDTVGGMMFTPCLETLAQSGRLIEISAPLDNRHVCFDLLDFYRRELRLLGVNSLSANATACGRILSQLAPGFESNHLCPPLIGKSYPLEETIHAYEEVMNRANSGKVLLTPRE